MPLAHLLWLCSERKNVFSKKVAGDYNYFSAINFSDIESNERFKEKLDF